MGMRNLGELFESDIWAILSLDNNGRIISSNKKAISYFGSVVGEYILTAFPWFREEWLYDTTKARIIKPTAYDKMLLDIMKNDKQKNVVLFFKNVDEYRNLTHLWCEVEDSLIMLQPFIDNSHDGIVITNGQGTIRATNQAFCNVSGLTEDDILGKSVFELCKQGLIPPCSMMATLENKRAENSVTKFPKGKETIVSSKPLVNKRGDIIRVLSNVRDITELEELHEKIRSAEAKVKHLQHEVDAKTTIGKINTGHRSRVMDELYELVKKVADTNIPLLILGESGVGKTVLAKQIHNLSDRKDSGTFVHINCSAIPESLLESELFGYEAGAFTGASKMKIGLFELANGGTIFLDEIGDMPLVLQAKLLNVLQEKKFYRVGGTKSIETDARIIAATNQSLEKLISEGRFRRDLYFRLNVIPITIPALRDRKEDIDGIITHVVAEVNERYRCSKTLAADTLLILESYDWPGNIRELKNVIERIMVLTKDDIIEPQHLPVEVRIKQKGMSLVLNDSSSNGNGASGLYWNPGEPLKVTVGSIERQIIEQAIALYGSVKIASKKLGVDESTITRKRSKAGTPKK